MHLMYQFGKIEMAISKKFYSLKLQLIKLFINLNITLVILLLIFSLIFMVNWRTHQMVVN